MLVNKQPNTINLYNHQRQALVAMGMADKGQILMPTGTGKTFVQSAHISNHLNQANVFVIVAPRIMLTYQLMEEHNKFYAAFNLFPELMFVHSGSAANKEELLKARASSNQPFEVIATTNSEQIKEKLQTSTSKNRPIIIFSTYDSLERVKLGARKAGKKIRCAIFDEAHYLVQEGYHETLSEFDAEEKFFFTATAKHTESDESTGMNNISSYGEVLYHMTIASAINAGLCVRPRAHVLDTEAEYNTEDFKKSVPKVIYRAAQEHQEELFNESSDRYSIRQPKMLVSLRGTENIDSFFGSEYCAQLIEDGYEIYAISSQHGAVVNSLENIVQRSIWLKNLKESLGDSKKKVIVLHYDILSEGIDASGFSGALLLRNMNTSKFMQTFGRINRLDPVDREAFSQGVYKPSDTEQMRKPYAYIMFPRFTKGDLNNSEQFKGYIQLMRTLGADLNDYSYSLDRGDDGGNEDPDEFLDNLEEMKRKIGNEISGIYSNIESKEEAKKMFMALESEDVEDVFAAFADI